MTGKDNQYALKYDRVFIEINRRPCSLDCKEDSRHKARLVGYMVLVIVLASFMTACNKPNNESRESEKQSVSVNSEQVYHKSNNSDIDQIPTHQKNIIEPTTEPVTKPNEFKKVNIKEELNESIHESVLVENQLWFYGEGAIKTYDLAAKTLSSYPTDTYVNQIRFINNDIWFYNFVMFGSDYEEKEIPLIRYDLKTRKFHEYSDNILQLGSNLTLFDDGQYAWIAGDYGLLSKLNLENNTIESLPNEIEDRIPSIMGDQNHIWIGSFSDGIHEINKQTGIITLYNETNELINNSAIELLVNDHFLWVNWGGEGTESGVSKLHRTDGKWEHFVDYLGDLEDRSGNLTEEDINPSIKGYNGYMWMDDNNNIWVQFLNQETGDYELRVFESKSSQWRMINLPGFSYNSITTINDDLVFIGASDGLLQFNMKTGDFEWVIQNEDIENVHRLSDHEFIVLGEKVYRLQIEE